MFESDRDAPVVETVLPDFTVKEGSDLYLMNAFDGSSQTRLTVKSEAHHNGVPSWSPFLEYLLEPYPR